jgi:hypothetical protein
MHLHPSKPASQVDGASSGTTRLHPQSTSRSDLAVDLFHNLRPPVDDRQHLVGLVGREHRHHPGDVSRTVARDKRHTPVQKFPEICIRRHKRVPAVEGLDFLTFGELHILTEAARDFYQVGGWAMGRP